MHGATVLARRLGHGQENKPLRAKNWQLVLYTFVFPFDPSIPKKRHRSEGVAVGISLGKGKEAKKRRFLLSVGSTNRDTCNLQRMVVESWNIQSSVSRPGLVENQEPPLIATTLTETEELETEQPKLCNKCAKDDIRRYIIKPIKIYGTEIC